ncbi:MAG: hypothetical protein ACI92B_002585, partial [Marinobacter maritimus]
ALARNTATITVVTNSNVKIAATNPGWDTTNSLTASGTDKTPLTFTYLSALTLAYARITFYRIVMGFSLSVFGCGGRVACITTVWQFGNAPESVSGRGT